MLPSTAFFLSTPYTNFESLVSSAGEQKDIQCHHIQSVQNLQCECLATAGVQAVRGKNKAPSSLYRQTNTSPCVYIWIMDELECDFSSRIIFLKLYKTVTETQKECCCFVVYCTRMLVISNYLAVNICNVYNIVLCFCMLVGLSPTLYILSPSVK